MLTFLQNLFIGKRNWELIDKEYYQSPLERAFSNNRITKIRLSEDHMKATIVYIFKCSLTGKVKKEVIKV